MTDPNAESELRQGDLLIGIDRLHVHSEGGADDDVVTPDGVAVLTQCCDLAQNPSGYVHLARVVRLEGNALNEAKSGRTSRYAWLVDDRFADLAFIESVPRGTADALDLSNRLDAVRRAKFAGQVARRFSRFAYPDELTPVLGPLKRKIREKAPKSGPIGLALNRIVTLRMECEPSWDAMEDLVLTLLVIVEPEFLPAIDELEDVAAAVSPVATTPDVGTVAEQILGCTTADPQLVDLWDAFGEALRSLLQAGTQDAPEGLVADVGVEVMRTDEFTYERYRHSVDLDFDYLSA